MRRSVRRAVLAAVPVIALAAGALIAAGCGKKGPPLPPLVKLPVAPSGVTAARRATSVDVTVTLPASNTDGTRPANVARVDVYAITGPLGNATEDALTAYGTKIGSVAVKAPRDPNLTVDVDDPDSDIEPPEGRGFDQGATTHVLDAGTRLVATSLLPPVPVKLLRQRRQRLLCSRVRRSRRPCASTSPSGSTSAAAVGRFQRARRSRSSTGRARRRRWP